MFYVEVNILQKIDAYLEDILALTDISRSCVPLLRELIESKNKDGYIFVNSALKRLLSKKLDMAIGSIENTITKFVDKGILIRVDRGMYIANKDIVDFTVLKEHDDIKITIYYSDNGRNIKSMKTTKEQQKEVALYDDRTKEK